VKRQFAQIRCCFTLSSTLALKLIGIFDHNVTRQIHKFVGDLV